MTAALFRGPAIELYYSAFAAYLPFLSGLPAAILMRRTQRASYGLVMRQAGSAIGLGS